LQRNEVEFDSSVTSPSEAFTLPQPFLRLWKTHLEENMLLSERAVFLSGLASLDPVHEEALFYV